MATTFRTSVGVVKVAPKIFVEIQVLTQATSADPVMLDPDEVIGLGQAITKLGKACRELRQEFAV